MSGSMPYAEADFMKAWAELQMLREPDVIIGDNYLRRWWIVPRNYGCNVYLHEILHSDDDRALHDHPWDNTSMLISGGYIEHTPEGMFERGAGDIVHRKATDSHRLEILEGRRAISLFMTGPTIRDWGFHCPQGWRHWREFTKPGAPGQIGRGCGE